MRLKAEQPYNLQQLKKDKNGVLSKRRRAGVPFRFAGGGNPSAFL